MKLSLSIIGILFTACLDPKINVDVNIERIEDTSASSSQPSSEPSSQPSSEPSSQPSNEPSGQPSNEPSGDPNGGNEGGGNEGGGNEGGGNEGGGNEGGGNEGGGNEGGGNEGGGNEGGGNEGGGGNNGGGSSSSFSGDLCEEWLNCVSNGTGPGDWGAYADEDDWCFNNSGNVTDPDNITWFECIESNEGNCSAVVACGSPTLP